MKFDEFSRQISISDDGPLSLILSITLVSGLNDPSVVLSILRPLTQLLSLRASGISWLITSNYVMPLISGGRLQNLTSARVQMHVNANKRKYKTRVKRSLCRRISRIRPCHSSVLGYVRVDNVHVECQAL